VSAPPRILRRRESTRTSCRIASPSPTGLDEDLLEDADPLPADELGSTENIEDDDLESADDE
jgi:hypothetical protein